MKIDEQRNPQEDLAEIKKGNFLPFFQCMSISEFYRYLDNHVLALEADGNEKQRIRNALFNYLIENAYEIYVEQEKLILFKKAQKRYDDSYKTFLPRTLSEYQDFKDWIIRSACNGDDSATEGNKNVKKVIEIMWNEEGDDRLAASRFYNFYVKMHNTAKILARNDVNKIYGDVSSNKYSRLKSKVGHEVYEIYIDQIKKQIESIKWNVGRIGGHTIRMENGEWR